MLNMALIKGIKIRPLASVKRGVAEFYIPSVQSRNNAGSAREFCAGSVARADAISTFL